MEISWLQTVISLAIIFLQGFLYTSVLLRSQRLCKTLRDKLLDAREETLDIAKEMVDAGAFHSQKNIPDLQSRIKIWRDEIKWLHSVKI